MTQIVDKFSLVETRSGNLTLKIKCEDGSVKTLHSLYDPETEARSMVSAFEFDGRGILVVLGLGLGYHVAELGRKFTDTDILVVEESPEIHELAIKHGPSIEGNVKFITGVSPDEVIRKIAACQMKDGIKPLSVFTLSSGVSAFPDYYRPILASLKKTVSVKLWDRLRYKKFKEETLTVLLFDSGYFLVNEIEKALRSHNHKVVRASVLKGDRSEAVIPEFIQSVMKVKPDFILTMNHLGFDEEGVLASFFKSIEMPVASWYVDSPNLIVKAFDKNVSPYMSLFIWDRTYMADMESMGFESVNYLPLGTDENIFRPVKKNPKSEIRNPKFFCDVGFVGNSMIDPVNEWTSKFNEEFYPLMNSLAGKLAGTGKTDAFFSMKLLPDNHNLDEKQMMDFEAAVLWKATLLYRLSCVKMLDGFDVHIHGDRGWKNLLNGREVKLYPPLNYYKELPLFYNTCKINFNATSRQMKEAVNQRVFDVPACGAFILTDYQKSLDELFDVGKEMIVYREKDEIPGLVKYYLDNPEKREAVAKKGMERVLKEHTYMHRLDVLVRSMKERYA